MKWEYLIAPTSAPTKIDNGRVEIFLYLDFDKKNKFTFHQLGENGWELVTVLNKIAYFKRPNLSIDDKEFPTEFVEALTKGLQLND